MTQVYINSIGIFLPGDPVENDEMEDVLGKVNNRSSKARRKILNSNGIKKRHYAIDKNQRTLFSNSQLAAHAIRHSIARADLAPNSVDLLVAGTTFPDLLVPGFGSMVHGELSEFSPIEVVSTHGVCCCGMTALKYAMAMVQLGQKKIAVSAASELPSRLFKNTRFEAETKIQQGKHVDFDTEFLRWMLSDGAGAAVLQPQPKVGQLSLSIEWIELISHAHELPVCMYTGRNQPDSKKNWMDYPSTVEAAADGALDLRQNIRLLDKAVTLGTQGIPIVLQQKGVDVKDIDWFLCHYSSHFFRDKVRDHLDLLDCSIPQEKWFTNLYTRGNTGAASIYLMLEELLYSDKLEPNQTLFCSVPESGRFSTAYMLLKTVAA